MTFYKFTFKNSGSRPQKLLVVVRAHYSDQLKRALTRQNNELSFLISVGQDLETVRNDGQELDVVPLQQSNHLWDATSQTDRILRTLL